MRESDHFGQVKTSPNQSLVQDARKGARMLRDDEILTPARKDEVRQVLRDYIAQNNISLGRIAMRLDCEASVISSVLSGTYKADDTKWLRSLDKWKEEHTLKEEVVRPKGFARIFIAKLLIGAAKSAKKNNSIALCYGPAGIGKSITMHAIKAEIPASIYVSMKTGCDTPLAVIEAIGRAAGIPSRQNTTRSWMRQLEDALKGSERLIMIDEVHKLVKIGGDDRALHMLRDIYDMTADQASDIGPCPMLWVGTSDVVTHIQNGVSSGKEPLDQLSSRIDPWVDLVEGTVLRDGGKPAFTIKDIQDVYHNDKMQLAPDAQEWLKKLANTKGAGALRTCSKLVTRAANSSRATVITAAMLDEMYPLLCGTAVAAYRRRQFNAQREPAQVAKSA